MTTKKLTALAVAALIATALAAPALAGSEFLFRGYAKYWDGQPPDVVGSTMEVYGILGAVGGLTLPLPLDLDNYQYTIYIATMNLVAYSNSPPSIKSLAFNGGEIHIYADPLVGGTPADYANRPTFMDGELILRALVDPGWTMVLFDFDGDGAFAGSGSGSCDFIGGTRLGDLSAAEYYLNDWNFLATPVADPTPALPVPQGYHRVFDCKLTPPNDPTPNAQGTWGELKNLFR